jgi:hypothetical protein
MTACELLGGKPIHDIRPGALAQYPVLIEGPIARWYASLGLPGHPAGDHGSTDVVWVLSVVARHQVAQIVV